MTTPLKFSILATAALFCIPSAAVAQTQTPYQFDESCAPKTTFDSSQQIPRIHFVLDKSGSMGGTKWDQATDILGQLADDVDRPGDCFASPNNGGCDDIFMGLSYFNSGSGVVAAPQDGTRTVIKNWLSGNGPGGGTNMIHASSQISGNATLLGSDVGIGVIVTDGRANGNTAIGAVNNICAARAAGVPTFMVGFGSGSDPTMNSYFGAAGGTAQCCIGSQCTFQPAELIDPCVGNPATMVNNSTSRLNSGFRCIGSIEASSGSDLKDALTAILSDAACTFPLDIPPGYPAGVGADQDPLATYVFINHNELGPIEVPFNNPATPNAFPDYLKNVLNIDVATANQYQNEGWTFGDNTRTTVRFSGKLCDQISENNISVTETQAACLCANTGESCDVECDGGFDDDAACLEGAKAGRCRGGVVECNFGVETCAQLYGRVPEICNGRDDNCDGVSDNMDISNPAGNDINKWKGDALQPIAMSVSKEELFCGFQTGLCSCKDNEADPYGMPPAQNQDEWPLLMDSLTGNCSCQSGLSLEDQPVATFESTENSQDDAEASSCSTTPTDSLPGSWLLLGLFGLFGLGRRSKNTLN